ncbi:MAG: twin-arginine translocase TatA/TatE family subunit [Patescibacteria group bacterium]
MFGLGVPELIIIVLAFGLLFFGSSKISEFSRSLGRMSGEYKKSKREIEKEIEESELKTTDQKKTDTTS